jgi:caa(3)-type oxidase subunit IV
VNAKTETPHRRLLLAVGASLLLLAAVSYAVSFASLGSLRVPVALAISAAKAALVVIFFMELVHQRFTNRFVVVAAIVLVLTLIALMAADVITRGTPPMLPPR